ncbi:hypothetical protein GF314_05025 [bacterium]|nr:hypothetical protein [bacterium]
MTVVWLTVLVLGVFGVLGWRAGVIRRLVELAGVVAAVLLTARFAAGVAPWLGRQVDLDDTTVLVMAHVFLFVIALVLVRLLANAVARFVRWTPLGWLDRVGGAVCGILLGALIASVGLIAVSQAPGGEQVREAYDRNWAGRAIYHAAPAMYQGAHRLFGGRVDELWERAVEVGRGVAAEAAESADR